MTTTSAARRTTPALHTVSIVGARPQFVKAGMVSRQLAACGACDRLVHTGQHYDHAMSDVFFEEMDLPKPALNLNVGSANHGAQTAAMLEGIERVLLEHRPDWVIVYGDTNSTVAGALAAVKLHVPVAHVEAGLRSYNRKMPEEINRIVTDHCADLLLAPTETAVNNLCHEGLPANRIVHTGDVMFDAVVFYTNKAAAQSTILDDHGLEPGQYVLATVHRAENTDDPERLRAVIGGLARAAEQCRVVLPMHPRTRAAVSRLNGARHLLGAIHCIEPVGYFDMLRLESAARLIATDSGGVQKEAFFQGVPCVTLREQTEWTELVDLGYNRLVPPASDADVGHALTTALTEMTPIQKNSDLYGSGDASRHIVHALLQTAGAAHVEHEQ